MIFFLALEDFYVLDGAMKRQFLAAPCPDVLPRNPLDRVYCTTVLDLKKLEDRILAGNKKILTTIIPEDYIRQSAGFPLELGVSNHGELERERALANPAGRGNNARVPSRTADLKKQILNLQKKEVRVAVLSGVGTGIGDTLVGLTALMIARKHLERTFQRVTMDALVGPHCIESLLPVYSQSPAVNAVYPLPVTLADFRQYDAFFDTGGLMHREDADRLPYVDFFLKLFGIDYWKINPAQKRNSICLQQEVVDELAGKLDLLKNGGGRLLLFHPTASGQLRSIPEEKIAGMMEGILANSDYRIITVIPVPFRHERVIDLAEKSKSFQHLCCIVSRMNAIITVDTSIYHIADAFSVPTVALFTSIDPNLRVKYYPFVKGIVLEGARETGYFGRHYAMPEIPLEPVLRLWDNIDIGKILSELGRLAKKTQR